MSKSLNRPRKSPKQERSSELVSAILEASVRIFQGTKKLNFSTRSVAEVAGISVGSLYQYFPNKEALIGALIEREGLSHITEAEKLYSQYKSEDLEVIVFQVLTKLFNKVNDSRFFLRGILKSIFHVERLDTVIENREKAMKFTAQVLLDKKIVKNHEVAYAKAYVITAAVGGMIETIIFRENHTVSVDQLVKETSGMIISYCLSPE